MDISPRDKARRVLGALISGSDSPDAAVAHLSKAVWRTAALVRYATDKTMSCRAEIVRRTLYAKLYFCLPHISHVPVATLNLWDKVIRGAMGAEFDWIGRPSYGWIHCVSGLPTILELYTVCRSAELGFALNGKSTAALLYRFLARESGAAGSLVTRRLEEARNAASVSFTPRTSYAPPMPTHHKYVRGGGRQQAIDSALVTAGH